MTCPELGTTHREKRLPSWTLTSCDAQLVCPCLSNTSSRLYVNRCGSLCTKNMEKEVHPEVMTAIVIFVFSRMKPPNPECNRNHLAHRCLVFLSWPYCVAVWYTLLFSPKVGMLSFDVSQRDLSSRMLLDCKIYCFRYLS